MRFTLLPEWAPQDAIMLTWPHKDTDWCDNLATVEPVYVTLCQHITQVQQLVIVAHDTALKQHIITLLEHAEVELARCHIVIAPCDDTWARDHGPLTTMSESGELAIKDFTFNGWGNKFAAAKDNAINQVLAEQVMSQQCHYQRVDLVLEGGAIEINETGVLLTTSECLLNPNRNPHLSKAELEARLTEELGATSFLWLDHGYLSGDDTDSHIDTLVRFAPGNTLVYVQCNDKTDEHYEALKQMEQQLKRFTTATGEPYRLVPLPWPSAKKDDQGVRLPATYANYLILNQTVLVPIYGDEHDQRALAQVAAAYPDRTIIGIDCLPIIHQFGSLHCITMQLPKGFLR
ncbi:MULTISPECIES: agmatine deiminase family protein [unclassified Pseudoalteromonas]|uniref:agmatine deiminase family protein n=1 Tax=unclassified Pseudoalteromonas TaxID=194690 RepID=UPI003015544C